MLPPGDSLLLRFNSSSAHKSLGARLSRGVVIVVLSPVGVARKSPGLDGDVCCHVISCAS